MKTALFALALLLTGCLTEPAQVNVIDCREATTEAQPGTDSTAAGEQVCR